MIPGKDFRPAFDRYLAKYVEDVKTGGLGK